MNQKSRPGVIIPIVLVFIAIMAFLAMVREEKKADQAADRPQTIEIKMSTTNQTVRKPAPSVEADTNAAEPKPEASLPAEDKPQMITVTGRIRPVH